MSGIPARGEEPRGEWLGSVADRLDVEESELRAVAGSVGDDFAPEDDQKEAALKDVVTSAYFNTRETEFDNSPTGTVWIQFPYDGTVDAHYQYRCDNPPHPAPSEIGVGSGRNWTCVSHIVTTVDEQVRETMADIDHITIPGQSSYLTSEFQEDRIEIVRGAESSDFPAIKRILTDGFGIDISDIVDAWGRFDSEWHSSRFYWNE